MLPLDGTKVGDSPLFFIQSNYFVSWQRLALLFTLAFFNVGKGGRDGRRWGGGAFPARSIGPPTACERPAQQPNIITNKKNKTHRKFKRWNFPPRVFHLSSPSGAISVARWRQFVKFKRG